MGEILIAFVFFGVLLALLAGGIWIPFGLLVSSVFILLINGNVFAIKSIALVSFGSLNSFTLTAVPLFILMGETILRSGLSRDFYRSANLWLDRLPGGLLQTNIVGSGIFASLTGSSLTTAMTMGTVAWPELESRGYTPRLALGSLAAGGTLGILIPPSITMILYGTITETSVPKLFMAGIVPGLLLMLLFMLFIAASDQFDKGRSARKSERAVMRERLRALPAVLPLVALILIVLGSIYLGLATPTEAAAVGSLGAFVVSALKGNLDLKTFGVILDHTIRISGMILLIVLGGFVFSYAIELTGIARSLAEWVVGMGLAFPAFIILLTILYVAMGCLMDSVTIIVVATPVLYPLAMSFGINPIWFGIYMVILVELGQITPPMGQVCFALQAVSGRPLGEVLWGVTPYFGIFLVMIAMIVLFPQLVLWLPGGL